MDYVKFISLKLVCIILSCLPYRYVFSVLFRSSELSDRLYSESVVKFLDLSYCEKAVIVRNSQHGTHLIVLFYLM